MSAQTIMGRVIDGRSKLPIRGVSVTMFSDADSTNALARASADSEGVFYIDVPTPGHYKLAFNVADRESFLGPTLVVAGADVQREFALPEHAWLESEVEQRVVAKKGTRGPQYPPALRMRSENGEVCAEFVVDTSGRAIMSTFKTVESTDRRFAEAVRNFLSSAEFSPAEVRQRKVAELVRMPFVFSTGSPDAGPTINAMQARCK